MTLGVRFYLSASGREPVRDWLKYEMTLENRRTIGADIKTVQDGWPLGMPVVRKMGTGLWEVRSVIPEGIARVLFTVAGNEMVLLHGFVKKSNKTPLDDIAVARKRKNEVHE